MTRCYKSPVYFSLGVLAAFYLSTVSLSAQEEGKAAHTERTGQMGRVGKGKFYPDYIPPPIEQFSAMVQRPLFSRKRRPVYVSQVQPSDPIQNKSTQKPTKTNFLLSGIVFNGADYVALIKESQAGETLTLGKGETIGGWVVADIKPEEVWLSSGAKLSVVALRDNKMSEAEKQKILRIALVKKKLTQRKRLAESRKKLAESRNKLTRE